MSRLLPFVIALTGCTFYISGGTGSDGGPGSDDGSGAPDATENGDDATDAPDDAAPDVILTPDVMVDAAPDAPVDAMPDAPPPDAPMWTVVETISVPCSGMVRMSTMTLAASAYRIRASGQCRIDSVFGNPVLADAEYQGTIVPRDKDSGVDTGVAINDTTLGGNKFPHWGNYTSSHVYQIDFTGLGAPITLRYHDKANNAYGDNSGSLTVEILAP